ncbi:MAG TPA: aldo/keto reductase [Bacteroidales bacterium]|nr:aldo/keto reductase [Bacteroidales bacterium]
MQMIPEIRINETLSLPVLGIGTWEMGGRHSPDYSEDKKWIEALVFALAQGIRHIDTAAIYGGGHTERLVGEAVRQFPRKDIFITTKVSGDRLQFSEVVKSANNSLKRLGVDQIDMLLLHWPNPRIPLSQTMSAVNKLYEEKIIRHFGLSNFPVELIREAMLFTDIPIATNQLEYNILTRNSGSYNRSVESEIIPWCLKNKISITAWRPLTKGTELGKYPAIAQLAAKYEKTPHQIALNWLVNKPQMMAIPKMSSQEHIRQNIEAIGFSMTAEEYHVLDTLTAV